MNLTIDWTAPTPFPDCGFDLSYRRNYDSAYTLIATSGITQNVIIDAPACYEGYVTSDCCSGNKSDTTSFGVNGYSPVQVSVSVQPSPLNYIAHITSEFPNPYDTLIDGTFQTNTSGAVSYSVIYPAGSVTADVVIEAIPNSLNVTVSDVIITDIAAVYDGGGALQQYDAVNTPPYFRFYDGNTSGNTSGSTWSGSPLDLPSFILRAFNVTATDTDGRPLEGELLVSWIAPSLYGDGLSPYNETTITMYDPDTSVMGTVTAFPAKGLIHATIPVVKTTNPLATNIEFTMKTIWGDSTLSATKLFYLPMF